MGVVRKNTLGRFLERLGKVEKYNLYNEKIAEDVAEIGREIAQEEYDRNNISYDEETQKGVLVESEVNGNSVNIIAKHEAIAYIEFGTGYVGQGKYKGKLPKDTLSFESPKGVPQTTQGWQYYYKNDKTKHHGGWTYTLEGKHIFTRGREPQSQMFNTVERLKDKTSLRTKLMKRIKGE